MKDICWASLTTLTKGFETCGPDKILKIAIRNHLSTSVSTAYCKTVPSLFNALGSLCLFKLIILALATLITARGFAVGNEKKKGRRVEYLGLSEYTRSRVREFSNSLSFGKSNP